MNPERRAAPGAVDAATVMSLVEHGAQVIEVLADPEYEWAHLPGARHVPLADIDRAAEVMDRSHPVVVYCNDFL